MNRYAVFWLLTFVCCYSSLSYGQDFRAVDLPPGMLSNNITKIYQQSNGYIWIATSRGIARYDGHDYKHYEYSPGDPNHISNNFVLDIVEGNDGSVWVATEGGLNRIFSDGHATDYSKSDGLTSSWIIQLHKTKNNKVVVFAATGVFTFDETTDKFVQVSSDWKLIDSVAEDDNGYLYLFSKKHFIRVNSDNFSEFEVYPYGDITPTGELKSYTSFFHNQQVYFGGEKGVYLWHTKTKRYSKFNLGKPFDEDIVNDITRVGNELWISFYQSGIAKFNLDSKQITQYQTNEFNPYSIPSNNVADIELDLNGNIWFATDKGAAALYNTPYVKTFYPNEKFNVSSKNEIHAIEPIGNKLLISNGSGLDFFDTEQKAWIKDPLNLDKTPLADEDIWSISVLNDDIWMTTDLGLMHYNLKTKQLDDYKNGKDNNWNLPNRELYTILAAEDGAWITGYLDVGLQKFSLADKKVTSEYLKDDSTSYQSDGNYTYHKLRLENGILWLATTDGLFQVDPLNGTQKHYRIGSSGGYIRVSDIVLDGANTLWATTEGEGLIKVDNADSFTDAKISSLNEHAPTLDTGLQSLAIDDSHIWLTSNDQIVKFNKTTYETIIIENPVNVKSIRFVPATATIINGHFYVGSNIGLISVELDLPNITENNHISITEVKSSGEILEIDLNKLYSEETELPGINLEFTVSAMEYRNAALVHYFYRLNGKELHQLKGNNFSLHNLWPDDYLLEIGYSFDSKIAPTQFSRYQFRVETPLQFYLYALLVLSLVSLLVLYIWQKRKRVILLKQETITDNLTEIANRAGFNQSFKFLLDNQIEFALLLIDIDKFKEVNDLYGHQAGDAYLQAIANKLKASVRPMDKVARLSGDEFVVILREFGSYDDLVLTTTRIHNTLEGTYSLNGTKVEASISMGVALSILHSNDSEELYSMADSALYMSKRSGRGQISYFDDTVKESLRKSVFVKTHLKNAIKNNEFELYYQPKVCSQSNKVIGFEALIRWQQKDEGLIPPDLFIRKAEETGDIIAIGAWVVQQACKDIKTLMEADLLHGNVSINISPIELKSKNFFNVVKNAIEDNNIPASKLEIEITETSIIDDFDSTNKMLNKLKTLGVTIALDDFGSGYSSLAYIPRLNLNTLKIDRSLVTEIEKDDKSAKLIDVVFQLSDRFGLNLVVEGIETEAQNKFFKQYFSCQLQGYRFGRPANLATTIKTYEGMSL